MDVIWIAIAFGCGFIAHHAKLPPLVGYLGAGFLLYYLGYESGEAVEFIAHLGVLLLLFSVGLKLRLKNVIRPEVLVGSLLHLFLMALVFVGIIAAVTHVDHMTGIVVAIALSFSSTVVAAKVLEERKELRAFHGRVAIGILIMQDLVAVAILSLAGGHTPTAWALGVLALPLLRPLAHRMLDWSGHNELLVLYGLLLALVLGGSGFELLGLSSELGALLLGILLADHRRASELSDALWSMKEVFLVGFFLEIGMAGLPDANAIGVALLLVALLPVKVSLYFFVLLLFRLRARSAFLTAINLATYSEFALIIANIGVKDGLFPAYWLVTLAFAVALSFVVAAPLNRAAHKLYMRYRPVLSRFQSKHRHPDDEPIHLGSAQIVIIGMGRVGTGAFDFFGNRDQRCIGLDSDPGQVERHRKEGRRVLYADAEDPGLWHNLHLDNIRAVLLAMPDLEANTVAVRELRRIGFKGVISATGVYPEHVEAILAAGADAAYNYFDEVGVGFAGHVWERLYPADYSKTSQ
ncbi:MAG: cation:proton antiporter [Pseudomonadota bacterium]|nr:MAG: cation:proton antiporter [Pseudomonadota bacterium]